MNPIPHFLSQPARIFVLSLSALTWLQSAATAQLAPGGSVYEPRVVPPFAPPYIVGGVPTGPTGYSVLTSQAFPYNYVAGSSNEAYFGSVTSTVYLKNDGSGRLAFSYKFDNLVPPTAPDNTQNYDINRATISDPSHPWVGVGILTEGADRSGSSTPLIGPFSATGWSDGDPFNISRDAVDQGISANLSVSGSGTILNRGTATSPLNNVSALFWVTTDATHYRITDVGLQDSQSTVGTSEAFAPVVPEPSGLVLVAIGSVGIALMARRARQSLSIG